MTVRITTLSGREYETTASLDEIVARLRDSNGILDATSTHSRPIRRRIPVRAVEVVAEI